MSETKLGSLLSSAQNRDAIHIAIAPVVAFETLWPGQHIGVVNGIEAWSSVHPTIGIVDPFLKHQIPIGQQFWICLYPQTISALRHEWTHPAFSLAKTPADIPATGEEEQCDQCLIG